MTANELKLFQTLEIKYFQNQLETIREDLKQFFTNYEDRQNLIKERNELEIIIRNIKIVRFS